MSLRGVVLAGVGAAGAYVLIRAATAANGGDEPRIMYVNAPQPEKRPSGLSGLLSGVNAFLPVLDGIQDLTGAPIFGGSQPGRQAAQPQPQTGFALPDWLKEWTGGGDSAPATTSSSTGQDMGPGGVNFAFYESKYQLPAGYLRRTAQIESAMNPAAKNPRSSAGGLFQFIDSTARAYGLTDRYDPVQATDAAARLASDNKRQLVPVLGRQPTGAELYLAHQQGGAGAARILRNPNARATDVVGSAAVRLNGGSDSMTAQQFAGLWINKFNRG